MLMTINDTKIIPKHISTRTTLILHLYEGQDSRDVFKVVIHIKMLMTKKYTTIIPNNTFPHEKLISHLYEGQNSRDVLSCCFSHKNVDDHNIH